MTVKRYRRVGAQNRRLGQRARRLPQARGFQFEGADALHIGLGRLARDGLLQRLRVFLGAGQQQLVGYTELIEQLAAPGALRSEVNKSGGHAQAH